jgi:hypothetical protein
MGEELDKRFNNLWLQPEKAWRIGDRDDKLGFLYRLQCSYSSLRSLTEKTKHGTLEAW